MAKVQRAVVSVTEKGGVVEFAQAISKFGVEFLSTGGTSKALRAGGIEVTDIADYTGFPEILDGRVKTLHPKVHGGLLAIRDNPTHVDMMEEQGIRPIDMVIVNLYQFEKTVARKGVSLTEAVENIDIGGPTLLRASAKNFRYVTVIVDPADYVPVLSEMEASGGETTLETRFRLAKKVFQLTRDYDAAISKYLEGVDFRE